MSLRRCLWSLAAILALVTTGCSKDEKKPTQPGDPTTTLQEANQVLEDLLYAQINAPANPQRPSDVNFTAAYTKFQDALRIDPTNATANFGAGVLGMISITQDAEVNAAFDEWKAYVDARRVPFQVPGSPAPNLGVPMALRSGSGSLHLPFDFAPATVAVLARPQFVAADPQLGRAQEILRTRALPRLVEAITRLDIVAANQRFVFTVTPRMQGDVHETPVEIDHTDVLAMRAACQLLAGLCDMAVAYDLNFAAYDSSTLVRNLSRGSDWMALATGGAARLADAQSRLRAASIGVDSTIVSLLAETDDQSNDVIKIGPDPAERARLDAVHGDLATFRTAIAGRWTRTEDWDSDGSTPPVALTFDMGHFFQSPVPDWKALLPAYTVSTERRAYDIERHFDSGVDTLDLSPPATGYYSAYCYLDVFQAPSGLDTVEYVYGDAWLANVLQARARTILAGLVGTPGWTREASVNLSCYGTLTGGTARAPVYRSAGWSTATTAVAIPVITWDAISYAAWTWPDPTLGGILPDLGSTGQLLGVFGMTANQWSRRNVLDWTRGYYIPLAVRRAP